MEKSDLTHPMNWKYTSPISPGLHEIISPENSACKITWVYRLNMEADTEFELFHDSLEFNVILVNGSVTIQHVDTNECLVPCDSFYIPAKARVKIKAKEKSWFFIGGAKCEGFGTFFIRKFDLTLPLGEIHQIHGKPPYKREVFLTINEHVPGSSLLCGVTWGEPGKWTSWPPHQHSKDLEEVYCYFDIPKPQAAFHFASRKEGEFEFIHSVSTGDCVVVPEGYHPTCGMPGVSSKYFWVMTAFSQNSRRYDLAVNDPNFD